MEILISTNMYQACDFAKVLELTDAFSQERVGVEVFSMFHDPVFADVLRASEEKLSTLPISFHGPYAQTEHSRPKGTPAYERSMGFYREMLPFAAAQQLRGVPPQQLQGAGCGSGSHVTDCR